MEIFTCRNTAGQRSEGRNLKGRWLFLRMVLKKDKGRHHTDWYQSASNSSTMSPTYLQPKREKHPEDLQLKSIEKAELFFTLSTTVQQPISAEVS